MYAIIGWILGAGVALWLGLAYPVRTALPLWVAASGVACTLGGLAIRSQPIGIVTWAGKLGSTVVQWGFRASNGRLIPAVLISWLVWVVLGAAVILMLKFRAERSQALLVLAWAVDAAALLYVIGVMLANRGSRPGALVVVAGILVAMIAVSALLFRAGGPAATRLALVIAGGPPLVIGVGYGLFVLLMVTVGRNARWN
jgi:hypothetical protein